MLDDVHSTDKQIQNAAHYPLTAGASQPCPYNTITASIFVFPTFYHCYTDSIREILTMCRNIKTLYNFEPPATEAEIRAASLQFVRKITGFNKPSKLNEAAFQAAVDEIAAAAAKLLGSLETSAPPRNREVVAERGRIRAIRRFSA